MSIDLDYPSSESVARLTSLLSRRPEYGIAIPSRRWLSRQAEKIKNIPEELLYNSSLLKRLFIKIADRIDPELIDPRAVLCKTHSALNPWLIRCFFLAVAYEVTVHTDLLRSWKGRMDYPILSSFVGRVDSIAALWTEPDLYRECYGTPPFEGHLIFVQSGCEACILSALGANARVLADLRTALIDRVERRPPHPNSRRAREPKLKRYVDKWISQLTEERAAKCITMSDNVLNELRNVRPQLKEWRAQRRKKRSRTKTVYTELKKTKDGGTELIHVADNRRYKRRTKNGIPVAVADLEGAEDQRRAALFSLKNNVKSVYRPDSLSPYSQFGGFGGNHDVADASDALPLLNDEDNVSDDYEDPEDFDDLDEQEDHPDLDRDLEAEERSRRKVADWYSSQVLKLDLTRDDTKSVLSMAHPAFRPPNEFSHLSAAPSPLNIRKDRSRRAPPAGATDSVWTDVTVYTTDNRAVNTQPDVPPIPRVPSKYRRDSTSRNNNNNNNTERPSSSGRPAALNPRSILNIRQSTSSSVYSTDQSRRDGRNTYARTSRSRYTGNSNGNGLAGNGDTQGYTAVLPSRSRFFASTALDWPSSEPESHERSRDRNHNRNRDRNRSRSHGPSYRQSQEPGGGGGGGNNSRRSRSRTSRARSTTATNATNATATTAASRTESSRTLVASPSEQGRGQDKEREKEDRAWKDSWGVRSEDEDDGLGPEDSHSVAFWRQAK